MSKILKILGTLGAFIISVLAIFFLGKSKGIKQEQNKELEEDNRALSETIDNVQKINNIDNDNNHLSADAVIDRLRKHVQDENNP